MKLPYSRRAPQDARPTWRPIPAWRWMLAAVAAVVIVAFVVTTWLLTIASGAKPGTDRANSRLDAVRTGLAAGAGAGAAVGLMLAFRRQHHQEIATDLTDRDATERRITELYTKAVEQLGSDKAPVRLGGLYALERLAQDNPAHRQTIVNVICAYLRMPFSAAAATVKPEPRATEGRGEGDAETEPRADEASDRWRQERQVRLTAQRILADYLRADSAPDQRSASPPGPRFWPGTRLDLADATLIDFKLDNAIVASASFYGATFSGRASFDGATFDGGTRFDRVTFRGVASFGGATFTGDTGFRGATFRGAAGFDGATFLGDAWFREATVRDDAWFVGATFRGSGSFSGARFSGNAWFDRARFSGNAWFDRARFSGTAGFDRASFAGTACYSAASFAGVARFTSATFHADAAFGGATFRGSGSEDGLSFQGSHVLAPETQPLWPTGWCLGPDGNGGYTVVRTNVDGGS